MEPLHDVYLNTDIEIDFRPETANGMLYYKLVFSQIKTFISPEKYM